MAVRRRKTFIDPNQKKYEKYEPYEKKPEFEYEGFVQKKLERKLKPGKDRFFHANYKHSVSDPNAYTTVYQLVLNEASLDKVHDFIEKDDIEAIFEPHIVSFLDDCFIVKESWDRFSVDMKIISKNIKDVLFRVECFGEDFPNDIWVAYALNGKYYHEEAVIMYPDFDATRTL